MRNGVDRTWICGGFVVCEAVGVWLLREKCLRCSEIGGRGALVGWDGTLLFWVIELTRSRSSRREFVGSNENAGYLRKLVYCVKYMSEKILNT